MNYIFVLEFNNKIMAQKLFFAICLICLTLLFSCGEKPTADFTYEPTNPQVGETVKFTNKSTNAKKYSWNFGDMNIGKDENPNHIYENAGEYIIDLSATNGLKSDIKTVTITVSE